MSLKRSIVLYIAMSLDGYIADAGGEVEWLYEAEGEGDNGYSAFYDTVDTIVMGRATYDQVISYGCEWPYSGKKCYVFTNREHAPDDNVEFVSGDASGLMDLLRGQNGAVVWLLGGAGLIDHFMKQELIDEFAIAVIPVILGAGIALFKENNPEIKLTLKETKQFRNIVLLRYQRKAAKPQA